MKKIREKAFCGSCGNDGAVHVHSSALLSKSLPKQAKKQVQATRSMLHQM